MSEAPLTDSAERLDEPDGPWVRAEFARNLERELAEAREMHEASANCAREYWQKVEAQAKEIERLKDLLVLVRPYIAHASQRLYDGTNGQNIRDTAAKRLAEMDKALAAQNPAGDASPLPSNPHGYRVNGDGTIICRCRAQTHPAYLPTPDLICWYCKQPIEKSQNEN